MELILNFTTAFILSILLIIALIPAARRIKLMDRPNTGLKTHEFPVPSIGGTVLFIVFSLYTAFCIITDRQYPRPAVLSGIGIIYILGIIDDFKRFSPLPKLIVQTAAAVLVISGGTFIEITAFHPIINYAITFVWIIGIMNAFNLMDIMDGLAGGIGLIIALTLFFISLSASYAAPVSQLSIILGFLCAFLMFNKPKASIYLGDSGSLLLGFLLAVLSINTRYTSVNNIAYLTPLLIFGIPIFDTTYVTIVRLFRGLNPLHGSPDHFVLRMQAVVRRKGFIVFIMMLLQSVLSLLAYISTAVDIKWALIIYIFSSIILVRIGFYIFQISNEK